MADRPHAAIGDRHCEGADVIERPRLDLGAPLAAARPLRLAGLENVAGPDQPAGDPHDPLDDGDRGSLLRQLDVEIVETGAVLPMCRARHGVEEIAGDAAEETPPKWPVTGVLNEPPNRLDPVEIAADPTVVKANMVIGCIPVSRRRRRRRTAPS